MKDTVYYCLVAIMKQFVHLMIDFYWLRSPLRWADIFRRRQEKWCLCLETWQTGKVKTKLTFLSMNYHKNFFKAVQPLQSETIAEQSHVSCENSNILVCFFDLYQEYCPLSSHSPRKLCQYLELRQYFPVQIEKSSYYSIKITR